EEVHDLPLASAQLLRELVVLGHRHSCDLSSPSAQAACLRTSGLASFNALASDPAALGSAISPSAHAACSRTSAFSSLSAPTSGSTAPFSPISPGGSEERR